MDYAYIFVAACWFVCFFNASKKSRKKSHELFDESRIWTSKGGFKNPLNFQDYHKESKVLREIIYSD